MSPIEWVQEQISVAGGEREGRTKGCLCVGRGWDDDGGIGYGGGGSGRRGGRGGDGGGRDMTVTGVDM